MKLSSLRIRFALAVLTMLATALAGAARAEDSAASQKLSDLFAREWEFRLREDPLQATSVGRHEYDDRLPSMAPETLAQRAETRRKFLAELSNVDLAQVSRESQVSAAIWKRQLEIAIQSYELGDDQLPWNADSGFHTEFARQPEEMPLTNAQEYENYLGRLRAWPRYANEQMALAKKGLARGMTVAAATLRGYEGTFGSHVVEKVEDSVFWKPFANFPASISESDRARLQTEGRKAITENVIPTYRALRDFFVTEYLPQARTTLGALALPDGEAFYRLKIREFTTLNLSPQSIHDIGLAEVARIQAEMREVIKKTGFQGDFAAFLQFLRTDPRFYAKTPEELLRHAAWIAKRMDGQLPRFFGKLPRTPYTVEPVPDYLAPKYTSGRYVGSAPDGSRAGIYWVNTYKLSVRPLYNLEALTLHEAVPGHHLQGALAQELGDLPPHRRYSYISAFGEGWGLYSEWLGQEAGFYTDPYSDFGRLTYEMWRACRLVVDTGLHALGWTRQQSIDYLASHTALPLHECETETDRYISWPAQALSYKLGEIEIRKLRKEAEAALGAKFDLRSFHDTVLGSGAVPLKVLRDNVERWVAGRKG